VTNQGEPTVTYFSYLRTEPAGQSSRGLLAASAPLFANQILAEATLGPIATDPNLFTGLAFQNRARDTADISIELYSSEDVRVAQTSLRLDPAKRISLETAEFFPGVELPPGGYVRAVSSPPVQMLGLLGDEANRVVTPLLPGVSQP